MDSEDITREGFFNTAETYRLSAEALERVHLRRAKRIGHADMPVQLLYSHAIELFLKALLRQRHSVATLRSRRFGHQIGELLSEAETLGLVIAAKDRDVLAAMADSDVLLDMRYLRTGAKTALEVIEVVKLRRTALSVRNRIADVLMRSGDMKMRKSGDVLLMGPA